MLASQALAAVTTLLPPPLPSPSPLPPPTHSLLPCILGTSPPPPSGAPTLVNRQGFLVRRAHSLSAKEVARSERERLIQRAREMTTDARHLLSHFSVNLVMLLAVVANLYLAHRSDELVVVRGDSAVYRNCQGEKVVRDSWKPAQVLCFLRIGSLVNSVAALYGKPVQL